MVAIALDGVLRHASPNALQGRQVFAIVRILELSLRYVVIAAESEAVRFARSAARSLAKRSSSPCASSLPIKERASWACEPSPYVERNSWSEVRLFLSTAFQLLPAPHLPAAPEVP